MGYVSIYDKAWGKPWPDRRNGAVSFQECGIDANGRTQDDDEQSPNSAEEDSPTYWEYICLHGIRSLKQALWLPVELQNVMVIRDDFDWVRAALERRVEQTGPEKRRAAFVLTGQPGIGKTVFLLYLLLHRLERRLPTAFQLTQSRFVLFQDGGAAVFDADNDCERLSSDCWALCDSNSQMTSPCHAFLASGAVVVQATSPPPDRWRGWRKQLSARVVVMDLPHPLEIAAVAKESHLKLSAVIPLVQKWGPCTRTVIDILADPEFEEYYHSAATTAAMNLCANSREPDSAASTILFIRPFRAPLPKFDRTSDTGQRLYAHVVYIPTKMLVGIFNDVRTQMSNENVINLFEAFSSHSLTRAADEWRHERCMHVRMSSGGTPLDLVGQSPGRVIYPARRLLPGTLAALRDIHRHDDFYWFPAAGTLKGIDGVLGDQDDLYMLRAVIYARGRESPIEGLCKLWDTIAPAVRSSRCWHFVVVTDRELFTERDVRTFTAELQAQDYPLGRGHVRQVSVWGCTLPAQ